MIDRWPEFPGFQSCNLDIQCNLDFIHVEKVLTGQAIQKHCDPSVLPIWVMLVTSLIVVIKFLTGKAI